MVRAVLQASTIVLAGDNYPRNQWVEHRLWIVATQDCDLSRVDVSNDEPVVELRPVYEDEPPGPLGIRSRRLRLAPESAYSIVAESPRAMISPASLTALRRADRDCRLDVLDGPKLIAFKTWLGKRYDRPAVPEEFVPLARAVADAVESRRRDVAIDDIRDILVQFSGRDPVHLSLFAVIIDHGDRAAVDRLLAEVALEIPADLGVVDEVEVGTAAETPLSLIETSFAVDSSDITWRGDPPRGALGV